MDRDKTPSLPLAHAWVETRDIPSPFRIHWKMVAPNPSGGVFAIFHGESQITEEMDYDETMQWLGHAGLFVDFFSEAKKGKLLDLPLRRGERIPDPIEEGFPPR